MNNTLLTELNPLKDRTSLSTEESLLVVSEYVGLLAENIVILTKRIEQIEDRK